MSDANLKRTFRAARRVSTPLLAVATADPSKAIAALLASVTSKDGDAPPAFRWDCASGLSALNKEGQSIPLPQDPDLMTEPVELLTTFCLTLPERGLLFMMGAPHLMVKPQFNQALWNLRDLYKVNRRTIVLLGPSITLPPELMQDILVLDEPLPDETELSEMVERIYESGQLPAPDPLTTAQAVSAVAGLASFPAEQALAMSLTPDGIVVADVWERKTHKINQQPGLSVWKEGQTFGDIAGYENVKAYMRRLIRGKRPPRCFVFVDEVDKSAGSTGSDTSGVKKAMEGTWLTWLQDHRARGSLFLGPGGSGKSAMAKACGNEAGVPTISFDLSGMQDSLVGASEARLREALKIIESVSQGQAFFIATCNRIDALSPELRRRFKSGTFFFDLPSASERRAIWTLYQNKFSLPEQPLPQDEGWTGAEIEACCEMADDFCCSLIEASAYIVPLATSARESIEALRGAAHGKYIDASFPGPYDKDRRNGRAALAPVGVGRAIHFAEGEED